VGGVKKQNILKHTNVTISFGFPGDGKEGFAILHINTNLVRMRNGDFIFFMYFNLSFTW
jgi:hypothetical protein